MERFIIWSLAGLIITGIFLVYFINFLRQQKAAKNRQDEAIRLGADKAIAQYPQIDRYTCIGCGSCVDACPEGEVLAVVKGKAVIVNGLRCVGHGMCAEACPVQGITVGLGNVKDRDDIPILDDNLQTNLPGVYIAGELGGLALIRNAITQGTKTIEAISLNPRRNGNPENMDVIIVGAGPAGLSAALKAVEQEMDYLIIDQQDAGGTILQYPRKKLVMTKPVDIPLYGRLDKSEYSKEELLDIWNETNARYGLNLRSQEKLIGISENGGGYEVITDQDRYGTNNVVLALGRRGTPRKLNVPGEDRSKVMYKLMDAGTYENEHILVVGGGDSAVEAAVGLARQKGNTVTLSYRKDKLFRIKSRNEQKINEMLQAGKIQIQFESNVVAINDSSVVLSQHDKELEIENDYVFIFIGGVPPFKLLKDIGIRFGGENSGITAKSQSTDFTD